MEKMELEEKVKKLEARKYSDLGYVQDMEVENSKMK